ncbi:MAG: response regulator transcription factor [Dehalococcoidia bacterium]|nr:response regulator transcription factor [Dehalococcoidia bacterium]
MLVLVADAEQEYAEVVGELLRRESHRVVLAAGAESSRQFLSRSNADLIILSTSVVEGSASPLVAEFYRLQAAPIIVLTGEEGPAEIARCFEAGADDCVRKPFHPGEFAARVHAVARRANSRQAARAEDGQAASFPSPLAQDREEAVGRADGSERADREGRVEDDTPEGVTVLAPPRSGLTGEGLEFDHDRERAFYNGADIGCSRLEYQILSAMASMDGQVLTHAFLNERVWGYPNLSDSTLLKGHVSSIRRKLRAAGFGTHLIRTVYGVGYALSA